MNSTFRILIHKIDKTVYLWFFLRRNIYSIIPFFIIIVKENIDSHIGGSLIIHLSLQGLKFRICINLVAVLVIDT